MKLLLTANEMMQQWCLRRGVEPLRADSTITRTDGHDLQSLLRAELDSWYARLLDTAPPEMLAPIDIADSLQLAPAPGFPAAALLTPPSHVRRILTLQLTHWHIPAAPCPIHLAKDLLRRQANPFTTASPANPVALHTGTDILLFPSQPDAGIATAQAVTDLSPDEYRLDSRALELITPATPLLL